MTRRTASIILDSVALLLFTALTSWPLTGLVFHEWAALLLLLLMGRHVLTHGDWIAGRLRRLREDGLRRVTPAAWLNLALFVAMGTTIFSGFVISKVLLPNALAAGTWIKWHSLHDIATLVTLLLLGLHLGMNWDLVLAGLRRFGERRGVEFAREPAAAVNSFRFLRVRRLAWLVLASVLLTGAVVGAEALVPAVELVHVHHRDGTIETIPPPPELARLRPGSDRPAPGRGLPKYLVQLVLLSAVGVAGRRWLRLRPQ